MWAPPHWVNRAVGLPGRAVAEGHLGTVGPSLRNGGIERAAVERLSSIYVSTSVLAPRMGATHGAKAAKMLEDRHVEVLRPNPYSLGVARRSDVEALDPGLLAAGPVDRAWESLRSCVGPGCGAWEFPKSMRGRCVTFRMSEGKVFASLEIGDGLVLTVDCSPTKARRRWRTIQPLLERIPEILPEFRLCGDEGIASLRREFVLPAPFEVGENARRWFEGCLSALADVFSVRPSGRIHDPEREQRRAEAVERNRQRLKERALKGGSRRKAPTNRAQMLAVTAGRLPTPLF